MCLLCTPWQRMGTLRQDYKQANWDPQDKQLVQGHLARLRGRMLLCVWLLRARLVIYNTPALASFPFCQMGVIKPSHMGIVRGTKIKEEKVLWKCKPALQMGMTLVAILGCQPLGLCWAGLSFPPAPRSTICLQLSPTLSICLPAGQAFSSCCIPSCCWRNAEPQIWVSARCREREKHCFLQCPLETFFFGLNRMCHFLPKI